ncbi:MAG TPA: peptide deformylase [Thiolapillus brandeum]|uniref:Peptide deformylase n=1 Tax=Thiolapillus brandeum TaxID=1076588 RepID=A0A831KCL1_9GAMM|nr:peptide deformylase [Thiolapillus brandeum]
MAILDILKFPDARLRNSAKPVQTVDPAVQTLVDDMLETMYEAPGIGLAATQVGVARQVVVIDISEERDMPLVLINPEIIEAQGEEEMEEGCLSVPGYFDKVKRAEKIKLKALDREGNEFISDYDGLLAVCVQHEIDHLHGKLFVDYLSKLKRERIRKKLEKEARMEINAAKQSARKII